MVVGARKGEKAGEGVVKEVKSPTRRRIGARVGQRAGAATVKEVKEPVKPQKEPTAGEILTQARQRGLSLEETRQLALETSAQARDVEKRLDAETKPEVVPVQQVAPVPPKPPEGIQTGVVVEQKKLRQLESGDVVGTLEQRVRAVGPIIVEGGGEGIPIFRQPTKIELAPSRVEVSRPTTNLSGPFRSLKSRVVEPFFKGFTLSGQTGTLLLTSKPTESASALLGTLSNIALARGVGTPQAQTVKGTVRLGTRKVAEQVFRVPIVGTQAARVATATARPVPRGLLTTTFVVGAGQRVVRRVRSEGTPGLARSAAGIAKEVATFQTVAPTLVRTARQVRTDVFSRTLAKARQPLVDPNLRFDPTQLQRATTPDPIQVVAQIAPGQQAFLFAQVPRAPKTPSFQTVFAPPRPPPEPSKPLPIKTTITLQGPGLEIQRTIIPLQVRIPDRQTTLPNIQVLIKRQPIDLTLRRLLSSRDLLGARDIPTRDILGRVQLFERVSRRVTKREDFLRRQFLRGKKGQLQLTRLTTQRRGLSVLQPKVSGKIKTVTSKTQVRLSDSLGLGLPRFETETLVTQDLKIASPVQAKRLTLTQVQAKKKARQLTVEKFKVLEDKKEDVKALKLTKTQVKVQQRTFPELVLEQEITDIKPPEIKINRPVNSSLGIPLIDLPKSRRANITERFVAIIGKPGNKFFKESRKLSFKEAVDFAKRSVRETPAASFKIVTTDGKELPFKEFTDTFLGKEFRRSVRDPTRVVQRRQFRISSVGEKRGITVEGLKALRERGRKRRAGKKNNVQGTIGSLGRVRGINGINELF